jgi:hypothetical protein
MWKKLWNKLFGKKTFELTIQLAGKDPVMFHMKSIKKLTQTEVIGVDTDENTVRIQTTENFDYMIKGGYNIDQPGSGADAPRHEEEVAKSTESKPRTDKV